MGRTGCRAVHYRRKPPENGLQTLEIASQATGHGGSGIRALGSGGLLVAQGTVTRVSEAHWLAGNRPSSRRISILATGIAPPGSMGHGLFPLRLSSTQSLSGSLSPVCISPSTNLSLSLFLFLSQSLGLISLSLFSHFLCSCLERKKEEIIRKKEREKKKEED
jgi:hypothetical protein